MARPHDVGGMQGFGAVVADEPAEPFEADWEARVLALANALSRQGLFTPDDFRDAIERMPPDRYYASTYYERYIAGICTLLAEKGLVERAQLVELGIDG